MIAPRRAPGGIALPLDPTSAQPVYRQIYDRVRDAIGRGVLAPGDRLPAARSLANQLGIARGTVDAAYTMLQGEGYIATRGAAGTVVTPGLRAPAIDPPKPKPAATARLRPEMSAMEVIRLALPFQMGLPALDVFPRKQWARLAARQARRLTTDTMTYPDALGHAPLREAIVRYLAVARGIACTADQVLITSGFQGALGLIVHALLRPGDRVWLEDPGYFLVRHAMEAIGAAIVPVPVDHEGIDVAAGIRRARQARFAVVSPSHQSPLGIALSLQRRLALLDWATQAKAWVVEDDYDSEFRYTGRPLPALKSLDREGRVLYVGSFSKVLFPGLRLGYLVAPEALVRDLVRVAATLHPGRSSIDPATVAEFMTAGHFARHIRRMRTLYAARRSALAKALEARFGDRFKIELQAGGMHLIARLDPRESDRYLAHLAGAAGLAVVAMTDLAIERDCGQALLMSFTNIQADQAPAMAERLARAIGG